VTRTDDSPVPDYASLVRLDDRRFVVLGAGQGIGRQVAHALTANGARVACVDEIEERALDIAEEVGGIPLTGNAYSRDDMARMFDEAHRALGGLDGVVDIIGMTRWSDLLDMSDEDWDWHFDIVLRHAFLALQYGGRALRERGGAIAFVASVSGTTSAPRHAAYGAAKAGLVSLVRSAARELGPYGIRVNAVAPGAVQTPRIAAQMASGGGAGMGDVIPLGRVALPADIAAALLFLVSDLAGYVTGQTLGVDGGVTANFPFPAAGR
jgi:NAD(P)-dependent dehydrogenase (short-subunit alcohol dehydrogenase family)